MRGYTRSTRFRVATKAERASRLGDEALRALRRFIALFRKYSDDQPRDDHGRWTYVGRRIDQTPQDVDQTGSLAPKINAALTGDLEIDSITEKLLDKLEQAYEKVGEGEGPAYGSRLHSAFAEAVRTSGIPNVDVETTWTGGILSVYGYPGSVRTDVALRTAGGERVLAVWDVKTGEARLSQSRVAQIRSQVGIGSDVPIIELSRVRGISIKLFH